MSVRPAAPLSAVHTDRVAVEPSPAATNTVTAAEPMQIDSKRPEETAGEGAKASPPHPQPRAVTILGETPPLPEGLPRPESTIPAPRALNLFTVRF
jgi:hypothetical protein